ncbi:MAG: hypothetical protein AAB436_04270 [Patescibacteria group bacterium]
MSIKNKNTKTIDRLAETAQQAGLVLMAAAVTIGMVEVSEHLRKVVVPTSATFAVEANAPQGGHDNPIRRDREETGPHYVSYSAFQRTPARSGKI